MRDVELRSDTFTRPSADMRRAMADAEVGDDVWNEDPTVHRLEERAADLTGKEAAVFVASGTQGNLIGVLSHTSVGDELVAGDQSHIVRYEVAGAAVVGGLQVRTVPNGSQGHVNAVDVRRLLRDPDVHEPRTGCIAIENSHNRCGGRVLNQDQMTAVCAVAHDAGIPVHLDGARGFNAALALRISLRALAEPVDSITFCLSKGLGAPVGSVLCGATNYIARARRWRKMLGGGMRQVGVLAAAGLFALDHNVDRLSQDHDNARRLADGLANVPGVAVDPNVVQTNMVFFDVSGLKMSIAAFTDELAHRGVRVAATRSLTGDGFVLRAVTSLEVDRSDIDYALETVQAVVREAALAPA